MEEKEKKKHCDERTKISSTTHSQQQQQHTQQGDLRLQSAHGIVHKHFIIPQKGVGKEWEGQKSVVCLNNRVKATVLSVHIVMLSGQNPPLTDSLTLGQLRSIVCCEGQKKRNLCNCSHLPRCFSAEMVATSRCTPVIVWSRNEEGKRWGS